MIDTEARAFTEDYAARIHPVQTAHAHAYWEQMTSGSPESQAELARLSAEYTRLFVDDPEGWATIRRLHAACGQIADPLLRRLVERLFLMFAAEQVAPEQIDRLAELSAQLAARYANERGTIDGQPVSENQIKQILRDSDDTEQRRAAWEASKMIGPIVRDDLIELVELRNAGAQAQGYRDYYAQSLALSEVDEGALFALLDDLERMTREPFARLKGGIDDALARRFGIAPEQLRPWHYSDPFFQEPPRTGAVDLDSLFVGRDMLALATRTFDGLGMEVRDILDRSDLFERPGKDQHAFCLHIDRATDDVRILCNLQPDARNMETLLHELGHAVYNKYLADDLPVLLRVPAHMNTTEAIAMLMGRLARDADWLATVVGLPPAQLGPLAQGARDDERVKQLVFARWALVMVHFERALYADPRRTDLDAHWWNLVERFQLLHRPEGRAAPDWAAKIHLAIAPVYYHNYVLGELTASQIAHTIAQRVPGGRLLDSRQAGALLREQLFAYGTRAPWDGALAQLTGEPLSARYFAAEFVAG